MTGSDIRGAVYIPAQAYNAYQMWRDYDPAEARRDLGYAQSLNLNALRVWLSYEYWLEAPDKLERAVNDFLSAAAEREIRVMPSLFECCGVDPTRSALDDRDPRTALCVCSPSRTVMRDRLHWQGPGEYIQWFMSRFGNDPRLLAIEVINEPGGQTLHFGRAMFRRAAADRRNVPLTVGSISLKHNLYFLDLGMDILQFHENFPQKLEAFQAGLNEALLTQEVLERPVWLTEWQRLRPGGSGWGDAPIAGDEWQPGYATLAPAVRASGLGAFFWSLMIKPAYLPAQRRKGTLNGVFHEDGAVWSLEDARAISGNPKFMAGERREWPAWARAASQSN